MPQAQVPMPMGPIVRPGASVRRRAGWDGNKSARRGRAGGGGAVLLLLSSGVGVRWAVVRWLGRQGGGWGMVWQEVRVRL